MNEALKILNEILEKIANEKSKNYTEGYGEGKRNGLVFAEIELEWLRAVLSGKGEKK